MKGLLVDSPDNIGADYWLRGLGIKQLQKRVCRCLRQQHHERNVQIIILYSNTIMKKLLNAIWGILFQRDLQVHSESQCEAMWQSGKVNAGHSSLSEILLPGRATGHVAEMLARPSSLQSYSYFELLLDAEDFFELFGVCMIGGVPHAVNPSDLSVLENPVASLLRCRTSRESFLWTRR